MDTGGGVRGADSAAGGSGGGAGETAAELQETVACAAHSGEVIDGVY